MAVFISIEELIVWVVIIVAVWLVIKYFHEQNMLHDRARKGGLMLAAKRRAAHKPGGHGLIRNRPIGRKIRQGKL